jgi:hypothetical protein
MMFSADMLEALRWLCHSSHRLPTNAARRTYIRDRWGPRVIDEMKGASLYDFITAANAIAVPLGNKKGGN